MHKIVPEHLSHPVTFNFRRRSSKYETDEDRSSEIESRGKGCWYYFSKCIGGMWSTRDIETNANKEVFVRTTIRELVIYAIFLVVLTLRKYLTHLGFEPGTF